MSIHAIDSVHYRHGSVQERLSDGSDIWTAWLVDFPGCRAQAGTEAEAVACLRELTPAYFGATVTDTSTAAQDQGHWHSVAFKVKKTAAYA